MGRYSHQPWTPRICFLIYLFEQLRIFSSFQTINCIKIFTFLTLNPGAASAGQTAPDDKLERQIFGDERRGREAAHPPEEFHHSPTHDRPTAAFRGFLNRTRNKLRVQTERVWCLSSWLKISPFWEQWSEKCDRFDPDCWQKWSKIINEKQNFPAKLTKMLNLVHVV